MMLRTVGAPSATTAREPRNPPLPPSSTGPAEPAHMPLSSEPLTADKLATFEAVELLQGSKELIQLADVLQQQVRTLSTSELALKIST